MISHIVEPLKKKIDKETKYVVARAKGWGNWRKVVRRNKHPVMRYVSTGHTRYSRRTRAHTAVGYIGELLKE